jgi:hypothetical protein
MAVTPEFLMALAALVGAVATLVVQTTRLLRVAERYMVELRRTNDLTEARAARLESRHPPA